MKFHLLTALLLAVFLTACGAPAAQHSRDEEPASAAPAAADAPDRDEQEPDPAPGPALPDTAEDSPYPDSDPIFAEYANALGFLILRDSWDVALTVPGADPHRTGGFARWDWAVDLLWEREHGARLFRAYADSIAEDAYMVEVPADAVEDLLALYFDIAADTLRGCMEYDAQAGTYWIHGAEIGGPIPALDVSEVAENDDGTLTLTVMTVPIAGLTDAYEPASRLTLQPVDDGTYRYLHNESLVR